MSNKRLTITDVANAVGVTPRTIMRWEKSGKVKKPKRDWRGWRFYHEEDIKEIREFYESSYEFNGENGSLASIGKDLLIIALAATTLLSTFIICGPARAEANFEPRQAVTGKAITETPSTVDIYLDALPAVDIPASMITEDVKYTLGPNDIIEIEVRRHPEFSGQYKVNTEGKIEYKFVGDIVVTGLTKVQLKEHIGKLLSEFIIEPDIDVSIVAYLSKVFYVVGEVGRPGKFYMQGNTINVREALMQAGLPTYAAATKACRLITPNDNGRNNYVNINAMRLLYEGNLTENHEMKPGDVLYMPATVMAKIIRVISPVTNIAGQAAGTAAKGLMFVP